ncbi:hypothetical protein C1646_761416 [Rhizophagus diaphanus]|nr:hypothetical protein C1646_761416 [Rhizophagus diaphanus] [Rhizophagus sp. MUCL 43196]
MALSFGQTQNDEKAMPVVMVPTVDVSDSLIDQLNNEVGRAPSDLDGNDEEMVNFLDEAYKKSISNEIRGRRREKKQRDQEALLKLYHGHVTFRARRARLIKDTIFTYNKKLTTHECSYVH